VSNPTLGTVYTILDGRPVRKVLMPKTRHHLFYAVEFDAGVIIIHAVWGAPRESGPSL
jgi:hypothetical protein